MRPDAARDDQRAEQPDEPEANNGMARRGGLAWRHQYALPGGMSLFFTPPRRPWQASSSPGSVRGPSSARGREVGERRTRAGEVLGDARDRPLEPSALALEARAIAQGARPA